MDTTTKRTKGPSKEEKAKLRAFLVEALPRVDYEPEIARQAVASFLRLGLKVPQILLQTELVADVVPPHEIPKLLPRLARAYTVYDLAAALSALQHSGSRTRLHQRSLISIATGVSKKLRKIASPSLDNSQDAHLTNRPEVLFTEGTLACLADFALWALARIFETSSTYNKSTYTAAIRLTEAVASTWRHTLHQEGRPAVLFVQDLSKVLPKRIYTDLIDESSVVDFIDESRQALAKDAEAALLQTRIADLDDIFRIVRRDQSEYQRLIAQLIEVRRQTNTIGAQAEEWLADEIERDKPSFKPPTAVDESQSSALNYVAVSLLAAWDAAPEGDKAARAFESTKRLAKELFKVELFGSPGDITAFSERDHDLTKETTDGTRTVRVVRPAVRWSDGIRIRTLVRAVVEPVN